MIRLWHSGSPGEVSDSEVAFAFASGRLAYDCARCGAKCCRGYGYAASSTGELAYQLSVSPHLALFVDGSISHSTRQLHVLNSPSGCCFLQENGMCGVQVRGGYGVKPETCRLFPFNDLLRLGRFLIVRPHVGLCPIDVVQTDGHAPASLYATLLAELGLKGVQAQVPHCRDIGTEPDILVENEGRITTESEKYFSAADVMGYLASQDAIWEAQSRRVAPNMSTAAMVALCADLLSTPPAEKLGHDADLLRTFIAVTPALRSRLILRSVSAPDAPQFASVNVCDAGRALLTLYLIVSLPRFDGRVSDRPYAASCNCSSYAAGLM